MTQVFSLPPDGLQVAPNDPRILAAGYQITVREVSFGRVHDRPSLMLAFLRGLGLRDTFGRNWDALYDILTDPDQTAARFALLLCNYSEFRRAHAHLSRELERTLTDAQTEAAAHGRQLWLLTEEPDGLPNR